MKVSSFLLGLAAVLLFAAAASLGMSNSEEAANIAFADLSTEKVIVGIALLCVLLAIVVRFVERLITWVRTRKIPRLVYEPTCVADNWPEVHSGVRR